MVENLPLNPPNIMRFGALFMVHHFLLRFLGVFYHLKNTVVILNSVVVLGRGAMAAPFLPSKWILSCASFVMAQLFKEISKSIIFTSLGPHFTHQSNVQVRKQETHPKKKTKKKKFAMKEVRGSA